MDGVTFFPKDGWNLNNHMHRKCVIEKISKEGKNVKIIYFRKNNIHFTAYVDGNECSASTPGRALGRAALQYARIQRDD